MYRSRVIPCLLLKDRGLVKTIRFKNPTYIGDPINAVRIFNEKEVDELMFLDITATKENRIPNYKLIRDIASECFMPFAYGGGIRDLDTIKKILQLGAEKVIINSYAVENPNFIKEASEIFGNQSIVISIDVKKTLFSSYEIYTYSGSKNTLINPFEFAGLMEMMGAGELFLNSIDRDGTMKGYDIDLIKKITSKISIPLVASGGAGELQHIKEVLRDGKASAASAGSMFVFYGSRRAVLINYPSSEELKKLNNINYNGII